MTMLPIRPNAGPDALGHPLPDHSRSHTRSVCRPVMPPAPIRSGVAAGPDGSADLCPGCGCRPLPDPLALLCSACEEEELEKADAFDGFGENYLGSDQCHNCGAVGQGLNPAGDGCASCGAEVAF